MAAQLAGWTVAQPTLAGACLVGQPTPFLEPLASGAVQSAWQLLVASASCPVGACPPFQFESVGDLI